ncbi:MAG: hypothetical protein ACYSYV_07440 [Planctomycetota bacterium]|jgi:hypothetical protein
MEWPEINVAVEELTFSLFQRPLHPELFQVYAKRELRTAEVVSSPGQILPQRGLIERFQFRGPRSHKCALTSAISYMTDFQVEKMSANLYRQSHIDLKRFARNRGMFVKFPTLEVGGLPPFCYIDFEARQSEVAYPRVLGLSRPVDDD